jgi:hypothetical protein
VSKLEEIEAAAEALPPEEKQQLMLFLAGRLRAEGVKMPEPRKFSTEQMAAWVKEDEADFARFQRGK